MKKFAIFSLCALTVAGMVAGCSGEPKPEETAPPKGAAAMQSGTANSGAASQTAQPAAPPAGQAP